MLRQQPVLVNVVKRFKKTQAGFFVKPRDPKKVQDSIGRALDHFDDFYKSVFGPKWPGIRASLLTENKFAAIVNNYGEPDKICENIEMKGAVNVRQVFETFYDKKSEENVELFNRANKKTLIDKRLDQIVKNKQETEIRAIYQNHAEEGIEKLRMEQDFSRVIEAQDVMNYKKSLQKSLEEDTEYDENRMISAEIGLSGLQEFIPSTKLKGMVDYIPESDHYQYYQKVIDFPLTFEPDTSFQFPKTLNIYIYPKQDISRFQRPKKCLTEVSSHFLCDGASILPPLMLNVQPDDLVLDACSAPGGKSLIMLQTSIPDLVVCNDMHRSLRVRKLMREFFPDFEKNWEGERCEIMEKDIRTVPEFSKYDKILVDVPCSNDRLSVFQNHNSMFNGARTRERLQLPELQASILVHCLQLLKPGGSLVYSTCSLSPVQNDGVVGMALSKAFKELHITATIKDLTNVLQPFKKFFFFLDPKELKYGQLVLPQLTANFGPMYICKIQRNEN